MSKFKIFILATALLAVTFFATVFGWYLKDVHKHYWLVTLVSMLAFLVYLVAEADLIHRFSGIPTKKTRKLIEKASPADLTHQQFNTLNHYWAVWFAVYIAVGLAYTAIFKKNSWGSSLGVLAPSAIFGFIGFMENKWKIKGYDKKDLFQ